MRSSNAMPATRDSQLDKKGAARASDSQSPAAPPVRARALADGKLLYMAVAPPDRRTSLSSSSIQDGCRPLHAAVGQLRQRHPRLGGGGRPRRPGGAAGHHRRRPQVALPATFLTRSVLLERSAMSRWAPLAVATLSPWDALLPIDA
jgi:hypothetical protein